MERNYYFENIRKIFERNFEITRLYATYLERFPEVITAELIKDITKDGISQEDALRAVLCELFALELDRPSDMRLYREYLIPSVRMMDTRRYTENPYYRNVPLTDKKIGDWEIRSESYPAYRGVIARDMDIREDFTEIPPLGFFPEEFSFPAVLEGGNEWMTLTPVDLDTCEEAIEAAWGDVITFGLGLGYYAYMVARKPEVRSITVVERSPDVIRLFRECILPHFESPEKLRIIEADAFEYAEHTMPKERYDLAFVDTWRDASDGAPMYRRMKRLERYSPNTKFLYWIENFLISRLRALRFAELADLYDKGELNMSSDEIRRELTEVERLIK